MVRYLNLQKNSGRRTIDFYFPCFVCLSGISFNSAIDTDWLLQYYDETGTINWINMIINNYIKWTGERLSKSLNPRISRVFRLIFTNLDKGTKMYSIDFITSRGVYDSVSNAYPS